MRRLGLLVLLPMLTSLLPQPALTFPPPKVVAPDDDTKAAIDSLSDKLAASVDRLRKLGVRDPALGDIEIHLEAARRIVRHNEFYGSSAKSTVAVLEHGLLRASQQSRGEAPWLNAVGRAVPRAYRSRIDGSLQPYAVTYPHDFGKAKRYRVDVVLHGRDAGLTEVSFLHRHRGEKAAPKDLDHVRIDIFGRGNNAYRWAGESDVFEAVEHFFGVEALANRAAHTDPTRVVLRGFSMGGAGTWHIGLHRPDQFAVLGPGAGFTTTHGYIPKLSETLPPYQESCLRIYDAVDYAENAFNVPVVAYSGENDKQKAAAENVEKRLKTLGLSDRMTHLVAPKLEHSMPAEWEKKAGELYRKHAEAERREYPPQVRFVTYTLRYNACRWVELLALEKHYAEARVEAKSTDEGFEVTTKNVRQLRLALRPGATREPLDIAIDGKKLTGVIPSVGRGGELNVYLDKRPGGWETALPERLAVERLRRPQKTAGLTGPIDDAFTAPFLCVRGTKDCASAAVNDYVRQDLERFREEWAKYFRGELPIKDDVDVTPEDIAGKHLILFGDPASNKLIREVLPSLPLTWTDKTVTVADKTGDAANHLPAMIYPSPLAADKYVVLNSGHTFHAVEYQGTNALLYPRLGDFALLKVADAKTPLNAEVVVAGLFDDSWRLPEGKRP